MAEPFVINTAPALPESETTDSFEQKRKGADTLAADAAVRMAQGDVIDASKKDVSLATTTTEGMQPLLDEKRIIQEDVVDTRAILEEERQRQIAEFKAQDAEQIAAVAKAAKAKNEARVNFWQGNRAGEIFAAFLRGIDRAASSFRGETGPTGVDRIIDAKIDAHERMLIGQWEDEKATQALKKANHTEYLNELEHKKIEAANQSKAELEALNVRVEKFLQGLAPEKAAIERQKWQAAFQLEQGRLDQKQSEGYDRTTRHAQTQRQGGPPAGADAKDAEYLKGVTTMTANAKNAVAEVQKILADNGGEIPIFAADGAKYNDYISAARRAAKAIAAAESPNPTAEPSDQNINKVMERIGPTREGAIGRGGSAAHVKQLESEQAALDKRLQVTQQVRAPQVAPAAPAAAPQPGPTGQAVRAKVGKAPAAAAPAQGGRRGRVNGKPAMIYPDGTFEAL